VLYASSKEDWWKDYSSKDIVRILNIVEGFKWNVKSDFIEEALALSKGSKILDLACGYGRFSIELASKGYKVVGLDYSSELLQIARSEAERRNVEVEFVQGDMRQIKYSGEFDGVLCWANSFGFFSDSDNERVLRLIAGSLRREGRLLLDLHNKDAIIRNHLRKTWFKKENYFVLMDWTFDARLSRSNLREIIIDANTGVMKDRIMSMREYTLHEMKLLLEDAGLDFLQVYGDTPEGFTSEGFSIDSSLVISAQKK
jgi:2-polyprenyl-3-methyl-5-hydroxy-6-metoxy-1,4-benzoquinol methylase